MNKQRSDISQIRKYLNGELDAQAMHQLEREAQDDPLLMDTLDGYEMAGKDQQANLALLKEQLKERTNKKERRIGTVAIWSVAAGLIGFLVVVGLLYRPTTTKLTAPAATAIAQQAAPSSNDTTPDRPAIAAPKKAVAVLKPQAPLTYRAAKIKVPENPVKGQQTDTVQINKIAAAPGGHTPANGDSSLMDEMVMGIIARQKDSAEMPLTVAIAKRPISQTLPGKADGVTTSGRKTENTLYKLNSLSVSDATAGYLAGVVTNQNSVAVPNANVNVAGKPIVRQSDASGKFAVPASGQKARSDYSYQGNDNKKLDVESQDSLKVQLREIPISGSAIRTSPGDSPCPANNTVYPAAGWYQFNSYVKKRAVLPSGSKTGIVSLKFTVNTDGTLTHIAVTKSLSPIADERAVSILSQGGKWVGQSNSKPVEVSKDITFTSGQ